MQKQKPPPNKEDLRLLAIGGLTMMLGFLGPLNANCAAASLGGAQGRTEFGTIREASKGTLSYELLAQAVPQSEGTPLPMPLAGTPSKEAEPPPPENPAVLGPLCNPCRKIHPDDTFPSGVPTGLREYWEAGYAIVGSPSTGYAVHLKRHHPSKLKSLSTATMLFATANSPAPSRTGTGPDDAATGGDAGPKRCLSVRY